MATTYKDGKCEKSKWLHYCFGLTYLKPSDVEDAFCELLAIKPADEKLTQFAYYLTESYASVDEEEPATFLPTIWVADTADL